MTAAGQGGTPEVVVRPAVPNDVAAISHIERAAFTDPWSPASFLELVARPEVVFLVAEQGERVAGYAVAYHAADEAELANLAVAAWCRRQGVGHRLLDALLGAVRGVGVGELWLEVRASNAPARALYQGYGFTEAGIRKRYYDRPVEDAIVMRRHSGRQ